MRHLHAVQEKLNVFSPLLQRCELFGELLNSHLFPRKIVMPDSWGGFRYCSVDNGNHIPLQSLSPGEQYGFALLYDLIFRTPPGTLVCIDAPEEALDAPWQEGFVDEITRIGELMNLDFLVATRSPYVFHKHRELLTT